MPRRSAVGAVLAYALFAVLTLASSAPAAINVGVHTHVLWAQADQAEVARQLDAARDAGADTVRVDVGWASLEETGRGQWSSWHLGRLDSLVSAAEARGLKPLMTFSTSPCWASSAPDAVKQNCSGSWWSRGVQFYGPSNPQDFADALAFVARRYGSRVAGWEVWNEPNDEAYFKSADPVNEYARLLRAAYPAAKAAAPSVPILGGVLSQANVSWTERLYAAGVKGYHDGWSIHPYSDDRSPLDPGLDQWIAVSFIRGVPAVRDVMVRYGDSKPLWLTEFGWSTSTIRGGENWSNGIDESTQARYVGEAIRQAARWPYVHTLIYYNLKNTGADTGNHHQNFGLVRWDNSYKPSFHAFRDAVAAVRPGSGSAPPTGVAPETETAPGPGPANGTDSRVIDVGSPTVSRVARRGLRYSVTCPLECLASAKMRVSEKVACRLGLTKCERLIGRTKRARVPAGGTGTLVLRLDRRVRRKLPRMMRKAGIRRLPTAVTTTVRSANGTEKIKRRVTLKRAQMRRGGRSPGTPPLGAAVVNGS